MACELGYLWFRQWLVACSAPSHNLNQYSLIVNWTLRNKLQWNSFIKIQILSFKKNEFENVASRKLFWKCCLQNDGHFVQASIFELILARLVLYRVVNLTHLPLNEMATISQTIFLDAFSWIKKIVFWLKFHWSLFLRVQLTIIQHWFR